jgi:SDR family mycofactocin-dependent oxidoreductase
MGRLEGKVAFVTGAARGQGRSHCVRLAQEGADVIAIDICEPLPGVPYPAATPEDLEETARQVEALDRRIVWARADVRDDEALREVVDDGVAQLGRLDVVSAQAGLNHLPHLTHELPRELWQVMLDITLTGTWNTVKAAVPHLLAGGRGGAIVVTSSAASIKGFPNVAHYVSAKHGLLGLVRSMAAELGPHRIRVVNLAPTNVATDMVLNQDAYNLFRPDKAPHATQEEFEEAAKHMHMLPIPYIEPIDVSNALVFLASDEGRYITGTTLAVDAGWTQH